MPLVASASRVLRLLAALVAVALLLTVGATSASAAAWPSSYGEVPVDDPDRREFAARWTATETPALRVPASAGQVRLTLPDVIDDLLVPGGFSVLAHLDGVPPTPLTTAGLSVTGREVTIDLPAVLEAFAEHGPQRSIEVVVNALDPVEGEADFVNFRAKLELTDEPATADVHVDLDLGTSWLVDRWIYQLRPLVAGPGTEITLGATDGFWTSTEPPYVSLSFGDEDSVGWLPTMVSPDGRYLTFTVPAEHRSALGGALPYESIQVNSGDRTQVNDGDRTSRLVFADLLPQEVGIGAYVTSVYGDLFGRVPDPSGLAGWTAALQGGTPYGAVADGITYSREFRAGLVTDAYQSYLSRDPDPSGLVNWVEAMERGLHIQQMEGGFLASAEYFATAGGTEEAWVRALYTEVLGRDAAPSEVVGWAQTARSTGRVAVARGFLYSNEHLTTVVDGYYKWLLGRGIDATGQRGWVSAIQAGHRTEEIIAGIIASGEYRANLPIN